MNRTSSIVLTGAVLVGAGIVAGTASLALAEDTTVLRKKRGDYYFDLTVEPARPVVGHRMTLALDLAQESETPHPMYGSRVPVKGASLVATLHRETDPRNVKRFIMHPLGGAGSYGFHFTPPAEGLYVLTLERRGEALPEVEFKIGVGVETPKQDESEAPEDPLGFGRRRKRLAPRGGGVRGPLTPKGAGPTAATTMTAMREPAGLLVDALSTKRPLKSTVTEATRALAAAAKDLPGTVPDKYEVGREEYDALAKKLQEELAAISKAAEAGDMRKTRRLFQQTLDGTCAKCHVKYWWAITDDLSTWPRVVYSSEWRR